VSYTNRQLSFDSDQPVAIAGIAKALQGTVGTKTKYIAGLWSNGLLRWMLWDTVNATYQTTYRAPSWSWLAVGGDIFWDSEVIQGYRYLKTNVHAEIERWRVVTGYGTPFGEVTPTRESEDACVYALIVERIEIKGQDVYRRIGKLAVFGEPCIVGNKGEVANSEKQTMRLV